MSAQKGSNPVLRRLRLPLLLTRAGLLAEQVVRAFWPLISVVLLMLAALMLGLQDSLAIEVVWGTGVLGLLALLGALTYGVRRFHWPSRAEALARLDETLPGRPIAALLDDQAIGAGDDASVAVWRAHQQRMAARAAQAQAVAPDIRLARRDPFALRYVALLAFAVALLFGSIWRVGSVADMGPGNGIVAGGPSWEGWVEPPRYTGLPTVYLNDVTDSEMRVAAGSRITLRFYGEVGALTLAETISGRTGSDGTDNVPSAADPVQEFVATRDGELRIDGPGGRAWDVIVNPDTAPIQTALGVLGMPGFTAWAGMTAYSKMKAGETLVVGAATGPVGSMVGQLAKQAGLRVIGVAGGEEKCKLAVETFGFDACVDHRGKDARAMRDALSAECPDGIDIYFENVGGATLGGVIPLLNLHARVIICGMIAWYSGESDETGSMDLQKLWRYSLVKRLTIQGLLQTDHVARFGEFLREIGPKVANGEIVHIEDVAEGLETAPEAFMGLLKGRNMGKLVVKVG
ncbi:MAG: hypothetical protein COC12_14290 [Rhodobacteraceae bacterium]|nr:MAG: hypothetical protein COC12_14290 [Paracoccaceae bacterium]